MNKMRNVVKKGLCVKSLVMGVGWVVKNIEKCVEKGGRVGSNRKLLIMVRNEKKCNYPEKEIMKVVEFRPGCK